jgi:hypothetical protein
MVDMLTKFHEDGFRHCNNANVLPQKFYML